MKDKIIALICSLVIYFFPGCSWAANLSENYTEIGKSDVGILYVNLDNIQTLRKENTFFLVASVEERYTDKKFLEDIRKEEGLAQAAGMLTLYVFDNHCTNYSIAHQYIYDNENNICLDLGGDMVIRSVGNDKNLLKIYEVALKHIESKQKQNKKWL